MAQYFVKRLMFFQIFHNLLRRIYDSYEDDETYNLLQAEDYVIVGAARLGIISVADEDIILNIMY